MNLSTVLPLHLYDEKTQRQQKEALLRLKKAIQSRHVILFAGAGCSCSLGYPSWIKLLEDLEALAVSCNTSDLVFKADSSERAKHPLKYADRIVDHLKKTNQISRYRNYMCTTFKGKSLPSDCLPEKLIKLRTCGIVTTNFDSTLEDYMKRDIPGEIDSEPSSILEPEPKYGNSDGIKLFFEEVREGAPARRVVHIHGASSRPGSIILTHKDYLDAYQTPNRRPNKRSSQIPQSPWAINRKFLWAILATCQALFVGVSFSDDAAREMLDMVTNDLCSFNWEKHYALLPIRQSQSTATISEAKVLLENYGITAIFFEVPEPTLETASRPYINLDKIVDYLGKNSEDSSPTTGFNELSELAKINSLPLRDLGVQISETMKSFSEGMAELGKITKNMLGETK